MKLGGQLKFTLAVVKLRVAEAKTVNAIVTTNRGFGKKNSHTASNHDCILQHTIDVVDYMRPNDIWSSCFEGWKGAATEHGVRLKSRGVACDGRSACVRLLGILQHSIRIG
jgi:hypothetical protein